MQEPIGRVLSDSERVGDHCGGGQVRPGPLAVVAREKESEQAGCWRRMDEEEARTILTVPSHELDTKVSLVVWFQNTENVSLLCSW